MNMHFLAKIFFGLCSLAVFTVGCAEKSPVARTDNASVSTIGETNEPISEEEARDFADKFIDAAYRNDSAAANSVFDWNTLADRSLEVSGVPQNFLADTKQGMLTGLESNNSFLSQINQAIHQGGAYQLLRIHEVEGQRRVLIRLNVPEGGVNYHDFVLSKNRNGECRGIDVHVFTSGEFLSTTMRRMMLMLIRGQDNSLFAQLTGQNQLFVKHQNQMQAMIGAVRSQNFAEVMRIYRSLPEKLKNEKSMLLIAINASAVIGDDNEYQNILTNFRRVHPNDACIDFLSIDYFLTRQEYSKALAAVESVSKSVGGDPYLDVMAGDIHFIAANLEEAKRCFQLAVDQEPTLQDAWWGLLTLSLNQSDFALTLDLLKKMDQQFPMEWSDLTQQPEYDGFVASPQYSEWLQYLEGKPEAGAKDQ